MFLVVIPLVGMMMMVMTMMMMMMMPGGSHKVERGSELQHIFSPGPNSNQQMVRMLEDDYDDQDDDQDDCYRHDGLHQQGSQLVTPQSLASDQISKNLTFLWASFASRPTDRFFINIAIIFFILIHIDLLVRPPSVFPIDGLNLQSNLIGATTKQEWSKVLYQYQPHQDHDHLDIIIR